MASATENRYVNVYVNNKGVKGTYNELRKEAFKLRAELNSGKLTQDEFNQKVKELKSTDAVLKKHRESLKGVSNSWRQLKQIMLGVVGGNVILGAFQKLTQFIPNLISQNAKLADSFTDVQKTTGLSAAGVEDLNRRLGTIDTRTPRARLLELARDAGKLGIQGVENIKQFVSAADQIDVALGEDLGEGAITTLGKLNNLFGTSDVFGYEQGLLKLGSVINELGANSEASEGAIVDFISRLAGVAEQADITFDQLGGYGATLDALGQRTETASTAVSQAIVGMFSDTATYAKIAGKDLGEFTELLNTDSNEAFIQFLEGLNGNNEGLTEMSKKFNDLGIDGSRAITVLGALSGNTQKLREQQTLANRAFQEGTSLTTEFNQKNENAAGNIEKIGRAINKLWVNSSLKNAIDAVTTSLAEMIEVPISENLQQQRIRFNGLMNVLRDTNTAEETRLEIITQLNESYGDRIGNIDLETASMEDLEKIQMRVNQQYLIEIALQAQREKLTEIGEKIAKTNERRTKASIAGGEALARANDKLGTSYTTVAEAMVDLEDKAIERYDAGLKRVVQLNDEARVLQELREASGGLSISEAKLKLAKEDQNAAMQEQIDLIGQLKKDYPELAGIIDASFTGGTRTTDDPDPDPEATGGGGQTESVRLELEQIQALYSESSDQILQIERELDQELLLIAEENGLAITDLERQKQDSLNALALDGAEERKRAQLDAYNVVSSASQNLLGTLIANKRAQMNVGSDLTDQQIAENQRLAEEEARLANFQRKMAAVQNAVNASVALSGAIKQAQSVPFPGNLAAMAAGVAAVMNLIGSATTLLSSAPEVPEYALGTTNATGSFIAGDQGREVVNPGSVIPANMTQDILAANTFKGTLPQPNFSMINDGLTYSQSQQVSQSGFGSSTGTDMAPVISELQLMRKELAKAQNKRVVLTDRDWQEFRERKDGGEARVSFRG